MKPEGSGHLNSGPKTLFQNISGLKRSLDQSIGNNAPVKPSRSFFLQEALASSWQGQTHLQPLPWEDRRVLQRPWIPPWRSVPIIFFACFFKDLRGSGESSSREGPSPYLSRPPSHLPSAKSLETSPPAQSSPRALIGCRRSPRPMGMTSSGTRRPEGWEGGRALWRASRRRARGRCPQQQHAWVARPEALALNSSLVHVESSTRGDCKAPVAAGGVERQP